MSALTHIVIGLIEEAPGSTVDDLLPDCEGHTRQQVLAAVHWLANTGRLRCERQGGRGIRLGGSNPGRYFPVAKAIEETGRRPVISCVWDLGGRT